MSDQPGLVPLNEGDDPIANIELVPTTLGELGNTLPHGFLKDDGSPTTFEFNPPNMGTRKKLGALNLRKDLKKSQGKHTAYWLATALRELDGQKMSDLKLDAAALKVARLSAGDVLYLTMAYQYQTTPDGLQLDANGCGVCGQAFDSITVDLADLDVLRLPRPGDVYPEDHDLAGEPMPVPTTADPPRVRTRLRRGFEWPTGNQVHTVLVQPPTWSGTFWQVASTQMGNNMLLRAFTMKAAICGIEGSPAPKVTMEAIDQLWPFDVDAIDDAAEMVTPTPILAISVACPNPQCEAENHTMLDALDPVFSGRS